ncbi:MAG: thiosulfate oxidation carrier protein SoxY [Nitrosomonadales bacterium]|nr:thiosulfate oxidation carrier protein SoxY [Nitrosomonadales bacterium]
MQRRSFLQLLSAFGAVLLIAPINALAAIWNKAAFEATTTPEAVKGLDVAQEIPSKEIDIVAPDFAENGAVVQVEVKSRIPNTEAIAILVDKNPTPLIANFMFSNGAEPSVVTRIKMAETSDLQIIVKAGDQYFTARKMVEVSLSGC